MMSVLLPLSKTLSLFRKYWGSWNYRENNSGEEYFQKQMCWIKQTGIMGTRDIRWSVILISLNDRTLVKLFTTIGSNTRKSIICPTEWS